MTNIYKSIGTLYDDVGFSEKYGGSIIITGITIIVFLLLVSYFNIMINIEPIKKDWVNQRCSPGILPFAGLINPPPGVSAFKYTSDNFAQCTQTILQQVTGVFLLPIDFFVQSINGIFNMVNEALNTIREMLNMIRVKVKNISEDMMGKILNIMIPVQKMFMSINDLFGKVQGILASGIFTALGTYYTMKSAVGAFYQFVVILLFALAAVIIAFWMIPFTWGIAITMTIVFVAIAIPLGMIGEALRTAFDLSLPGMPSKPGCFSKNTVIETNLGPTFIENLQIGTILDDNSVVTAIMKINANGHDMYNLNNIIVSGEHKIIINNNKMISVSEHPKSIKIYDFKDPVIYCFSTNTKYIHLNNIRFTDWDEITKKDIKQLHIRCKSYISNKYRKNMSFIHKNLESGLYKKTPIELFDGSFKPISEIQIMDKLKNGEIVLSVVEVNGLDIRQYSYNFNKRIKIRGGPNLQIYDENLGNLHTLDSQINKVRSNNSKKLYHLITNTGKFEIYGYTFYDYNGALDCFLDCDKKSGFIEHE